MTVADTRQRFDRQIEAFLPVEPAHAEQSGRIVGYRERIDRWWDDAVCDHRYPRRHGRLVGEDIVHDSLRDAGDPVGSAQHLRDNDEHRRELARHHVVQSHDEGTSLATRRSRPPRYGRRPPGAWTFR